MLHVVSRKGSYHVWHPRRVGEFVLCPTMERVLLWSDRVLRRAGALLRFPVRSNACGGRRHAIKSLAHPGTRNIAGAWGASWANCGGTRRSCRGSQRSISWSSSRTCSGPPMTTFGQTSHPCPAPRRLTGRTSRMCFWTRGSFFLSFFCFCMSVLACVIEYRRAHGTRSSAVSRGTLKRGSEEAAQVLLSTWQ